MAVATIDPKMRKVIRQMADDVMKETLDEADKRTKAIIEEARRIAETVQQIVGVELPDGKVWKFDTPTHPATARVIQYMQVGLLPLLVGPAGSGKSTMAENIAAALGLTYGHLCFSAGVSEVWLFGRHTPEGFKEADFSRMYREGGVFLADELDAADANVLLAINTALSSTTLYNPMNGQTYKKHDNFYFIGAANTYGKGATGSYVGRNRLDAATLDRFVCVEIDYLAAIENALCPDKDLAQKLRCVREKLKNEGSNEVVSYRSFRKAYQMHKLKVPSGELFKTLFASWPADLASRVTP